MPIAYYSISALINLVTSVILAIIVIYKHTRSPINRAFVFFDLSVTFWSLFYFLWQISNSNATALLYCRLLMAAAIFVPVTVFHLVINLIDRYKKYKKLLLIFYLITLFFLLGDTTPLMVRDVTARMVFKYWPTAGSLYVPYLVFFYAVVVFAHILLFKNIKNAPGIQKEKIKYVFLGTVIGFMGGSTNYPLWFNIHILPLGTPLVSVYVLLVAFSIMKYRLMDIKLAIFKAAVFLVVYTLVLGIPFYLYGRATPLVALVVMLVLATAGPFIFMYLQRRAEDRILQEQRIYQNALRQASLGMTKFKNLKKLLDMLVSVLVGNVHVEHASVYIHNAAQNQYTLASRQQSFGDGKIVESIREDCALIQYLSVEKNTIIIDEIKQKAQDLQDKTLMQVSEIATDLQAELIMPIVEAGLLAFIVMGKKESGRIFTNDDVSVLNILANQTALAIENALFYEESQKDWTQRAHESRQRTMGTMATGVAHQIRNRFHAVSTQLLYLQFFFSEVDFDKIKRADFEKLVKEYNEVMEKIFKDIQHGEEICDTIKNYAKKTEAQAQVVCLNETIQGAMRLLDLSRKNVRFALQELNIKNIVLWTNLSMLQDMFYNMLDNSNDAMISKEEAIAKGQLERTGDFKVRIGAHSHGKMCSITVEDNGIGIKPEHLEEDKGVNVIYFTTKGASKGTGMGIPFMREFVRNNGGTFKIESEYRKWTRIIFTLPLATEEQIKKGASSA